VKPIDQPAFDIGKQLLTVVDLAEVQHMTLHHATTAHATVLNYAEGAVLLAVLPANLGA
jgi:hypothetical protein